MNNTTLKPLLIITLAMGLFCTQNATAQKKSNASSSETYGNVLNAGIGIGYFGYIQNSTPVLHANYEFDVAKSFTLAPFASFYSYSVDYYYYNPPFSRNYGYRQTVLPLGVKGTYYFDDLLKLNEKWDLYLGASLGFAIISTKWESNYPGDKNAYTGARSLYLDLHLGSEYHINDRFGVFLDLSTGVSTIGLAIHPN
jgi:hypothetical protein